MVCCGNGAEIFKVCLGIGGVDVCHSSNHFALELLMQLTNLVVDGLFLRRVPFGRAFATRILHPLEQAQAQR